MSEIWHVILSMSLQPTTAVLCKVVCKQQTNRQVGFDLHLKIYSIKLHAVPFSLYTCQPCFERKCLGLRFRSSMSQLALPCFILNTIANSGLLKIDIVKGGRYVCTLQWKLLSRQYAWLEMFEALIWTVKCVWQPKAIGKLEIQGNAFSILVRTCLYHLSVTERNIGL